MRQQEPVGGSEIELSPSPAASRFSSVRFPRIQFPTIQTPAGRLATGLCLWLVASAGFCGEERPAEKPRIAPPTAEAIAREREAAAVEAAEDEERKKKLTELVQKLNEQIKETPKQLALYSQRGDLRFFLGQFAAAVEDYDRMVELDPDQEGSHWRRGIAEFYAGQYDRAAHQFEIYHSFDNVDRENGIWRYLSQVKSIGRDKARQGLLKYQKDDREPFPDVYRMFSGDRTGEQVLDAIRKADISDEERQKRLFYAELYVGLNEFVEGRTATAREHLQAARRNPWGRTARGGPGYMWQVARLHADLLAKEKPAGKPAPESKAGSKP